jgi:hypothetical protein
MTEMVVIREIFASVEILMTEVHALDITSSRSGSSEIPFSLKGRKYLMNRMDRTCVGCRYKSIDQCLQVTILHNFFIKLSLQHSDNDRASIPDVLKILLITINRMLIMSV